MDDDDVVLKFVELRRELHAIDQKTRRAAKRADFLDQLEHDVGEELVRLRYLKSDISGAGGFISESLKQIRQREVSDGKARELYDEAAEYVEYAGAELKDIRVPLLRDAGADLRFKIDY